MRVALAVLVERVGLAVVPLDRLLDDVVAEHLGEAVADRVERLRSGPPSRSAASASVRSRTASHAAFTAPPVTYVWREAELEPAEPTRVSASRTATRATPSSVRAIWAWTVTTPWPTSAAAVWTSTSGSPASMDSRTRAVE